MAKILTIKDSNEFFGLKEDKQITFVATNKMYRRTVEFNRDLVQQDVEDAQMQQRIQKYETDVVQLINTIEDIRLSTLDDAEKFKRIDELQQRLDSKENPAADGEYALQTVDRDLDNLDMSISYLHDVLDTFLTQKQVEIIDEANGTDTIALSRQVAGLILGIEEDSKNEDKEEPEDEKEEMGLND